MIVRILGEGQYELPDAEHPMLDALDSELATAVDGEDEDGFRAVLATLIATVRSGMPVPGDQFFPSDLVVPFPDATREEVAALLLEMPDES